MLFARRSETVLVVEDQEEVSSFVAKALTTHGYRV
jgi:DNA-binding response OmpR family regulator